MKLQRVSTCLVIYFKGGKGELIHPREPFQQNFTFHFSLIDLVLDITMYFIPSNV